MKKIVMMLAVVATMGLAACNGQGFNGLGGLGTKQTVGAGAGAVIGGILGSQVGSGSGQLWATGAGALLGTLIGSEIGSSLDRADRTYLAME